MKLTLILFTSTLMCFASGTYSQNKRLSFHLKNANLIELFNIIENQTAMEVAYDISSIDINKKIDINVDGATIEEVMDKILEGESVSYKIMNNYIIITRDKEQSVPNLQQPRDVSGKVKDVLGEPVPGVSVFVKGTTNGTITNMDGDFSLTTSSPADTLVFSFIGMKTQEYPVDFQNYFDIVMEDETIGLNEVVVTALGIERSEKALSYNVQEVEQEELTRVKNANLMNSLSGKIAGVTINSSSSGVGGASKVVMRGAKSIEQSSNALYVIDGIPMFNLEGEGGTEFASDGNTEAIADINPEDIESISVLTGAAAAALYGSNAANGAIVITTKKGQVGQTSLTVSQDTKFLSSFVTPKFQNRYGTGSSLSDVAVLDKSWGKKLNPSNYMGYSPTEDYFNTGIVTTETIALSTGSELNQTYLSASSVNSEGVIPNNDYDRYNFTFRNTTSFLNDKLKLDVGASYIKQYDRNMTNQGTYSNPLVTAYLFPRGDDWNDIKMFERYDTQRKIYTQYWPQEINEFTGQNPYWINYRNLRENDKDRYMLNANLNYHIFDWLSISGRIRIDNAENNFTEKLYASSNKTLTEGSDNGLYGIATTKDRQTYGDYLVDINKRFGETFSLHGNIGGSISDVKQDMLSNSGPLREDLFSNKFNVFQLDNTKTKREQAGFHDQTKSMFASLELGYRSSYYLTLTGRNDWPSQLAGPNSVNKSFFYPSIGTSFILSEIFPMPESISYMKLRASFASVGLPFARFLANPTYEWDSSLQDWKNKSHYPMYELKPERTDSWEVGLTSRFLQHFNLDLTIYYTKTYNQTFNPQISVSSKYSTLYVQTGSVRNQGAELSLGYQKKWHNFKWSSNYTLGANQNKILELVKDYKHPETGAIINKDRLDVGGLSQAHFILKEGGSLGDLYSLSDLQRDSNGDIYIDPDGNLSTNNQVGDIKLGSVFPKCNMAWRNDFSWKNFDFGFMASARIGGIVYSATQAALDLYGVSEVSATARDLGYVLVNGSEKVNPEIWFSAVGAKNGIPQFYTYSATNVRLQEASIGYTIPKSSLGNVADVRISLVGSNLFMIYNKAPFDPESVATTGNYYQGIDNFMMPNTRNIGFNVRLKF